MAYPVARSMNADLEEGMSDGKYKKIVEHRGGIVEKELAYAQRCDLSDIYFGIHETEAKRLPDTTIARRTSLYVDNKPIDSHDYAPNKGGFLPGDGA